MKNLLYFVMVLLLCACSTTFHGPNQFSKSKDVFHDLNIKDEFVTSNLPAGSLFVLSMDYSAPYEDVFRMAKLSVSQTQFFLEKTDKEKGIIFASKSKPVEKRIENFVPHTWNTAGWVVSEKRFYLISVEELSGEKTTVKIFNKVQYECRYSGTSINNVDECKMITKPHWPSYQQNDAQTMEAYLNFVKNNLISAGLI